MHETSWFSCSVNFTFCLTIIPNLTQSNSLTRFQQQLSKVQNCAIKMCCDWNHTCAIWNKSVTSGTVACDWAEILFISCINNFEMFICTKRKKRRRAFWKQLNIRMFSVQGFSIFTSEWSVNILIDEPFTSRPRNLLLAWWGNDQSKRQ